MHLVVSWMTAMCKERSGGARWRARVERRAQAAAAAEPRTWAERRGRAERQAQPCQWSLPRRRHVRARSVESRKRRCGWAETARWSRRGRWARGWARASGGPCSRSPRGWSRRQRRPRRRRARRSCQSQRALVRAGSGLDAPSNTCTHGARGDGASICVTTTLDNVTQKREHLTALMRGTQARRVETLSS